MHQFNTIDVWKLIDITFCNSRQTERSYTPKGQIIIDTKFTVVVRRDLHP
jgi:hypothetical protein